MSDGGPRSQFLFNIPSSVLWEFCRVMDGLSDLDWTRFASEVLRDQTQVRLAERKERRTDWVMNQWEIRNGRVGELLDLLESLQLFRARDIILGWTPTVTPPPPVPPSLPALHPPPTQPLPTVHYSIRKETGSPLPGPAPPPDDLISKDEQLPQAVKPDDVTPPCAAAAACCSSAIMCWSYEEVHAGTQGFSSTLQVGEGGFGLVYRATLSNMDCAVKRLRQDGVMDWTLLRRSFQTEVEKLSKFRHPNIIDLLGFSEGGGSMCLIYRFMENQSLEDQLHKDCFFLSWPLRVSIVKGAAAALQFLHCPPTGQEPLIHGDVKSSNILLDHHLAAKLSDFGLARYKPRCTGTQTTSVGKTTTIRGTLAYLPDEYLTKGELCTAVDVYSFGVVLLEILTGRRALEKDKDSRDRYLKDLVEELEDRQYCSVEEAWRRQLDERLTAGGIVKPADCLQVAALACKSLKRQRKKRISMSEVFESLQDLDMVLRKTSSFPRLPCSLDFSVDAVSQQLSGLGPLDQTYPHSQSPQSSQSLQSSQFSCSLTPPDPLHSSSLPSPSSSSSLGGPCETDESRGFSQYNLRPQLRPNGDQYQSPSGPPQSSQPSVPTEDQYTFPPQPNRTSYLSRDPRFLEPDTRIGFSPAGSLQSTSPRPSVHLNPRKQRLMEKKTQYEEGRIRTPELLSSDDLYEDSVDFRGPEESNELDFLPANQT